MLKKENKKLREIIKINYFEYEIKKDNEIHRLKVIDNELKSLLRIVLIKYMNIYTK